MIVFYEPTLGLSTWRSKWPAAEMRRRGYEARCFALDAERESDVPVGLADVVLHISSGTFADVAGQRYGPAWIAEQMKLGSRRLFVSFSDDLIANRGISPAKDLARLIQTDLPLICRMADRVIVTTPRLAEVYGHWSHDVRVVEPYLPRWVFDLPPRPKLDRLGWMGTVHDQLHGADLELLRPFARDLPPLYLIGAGKAGADLLTSWGATDVMASGFELDQRKLYQEMGRCRAAVVPLRDTRFNRGKSWVKPMEFMARGVPVVASRHPEYDRLSFVVQPSEAEMAEAIASMWDARMDMDLTFDFHESVMEEAGGDLWEKALA